jgi:hypothetical protein
VAVPAAGVPAGVGTCALNVIAPGALGQLSGCPSTGPNAGLSGQFVGTAAFFNFFRPTGPNPSFALIAGGYDRLVGLASLAGFPTGINGVQIPFSDVVQQESSGNSVYHGTTFTITRPFSSNFQFVSSWTWSHTIDDSTDLQTLLAPQDNNRPDLERSSSSFDQRHRWVTSAVFQSPRLSGKPRILRVLLADFAVAPIFDISSGRPYSVLTGTDFNLDFGANTDRPSVGGTGVSSPYLPGVSFGPPNVCPKDPLTGNPTSSIFEGTGLPSFYGCTGNVGRNAFTRPRQISVDLRVARKILVKESRNVELIADAFNLMNRFNTGDVSPLCNPQDPAACNAGQRTAAQDMRQFQFAVKINW